jgi:hypothetical protein
MKPTVLLPILLCISIYSCEPVSYVRLIKDRVKETNTFLLVRTKNATSAVNKYRQRFDLEFIKSSKKPGFVDIIVQTNIYPRQALQANEAYFLMGSQKMAYTLENIKETPINHNRVTNENYTTYPNTTRQVPIVTTETKTVNDVLVTETKTEMQVVTESSPVQNTRQIHSTINYIHLKSRLTIEEENFKKLVDAKHFRLRIYNTNNDFWSLNFSTLYEDKELTNFLNNKVQSNRITVN